MVSRRNLSRRSLQRTSNGRVGGCSQERNAITNVTARGQQCPDAVGFRHDFQSSTFLDARSVTQSGVRDASFRVSEQTQESISI